MAITAWLGALADIATILGVPFFLVSYWVNERAERRRAEYGTFDALDIRYSDFQVLASSPENARLDLGDVGLAAPPDLSDEDRTRQRNLYLFLIAIFERAYVMYEDKSSKIRQAEWQGWVDYIERYCDRPSFVDAYFRGHAPSASFDSEFNEAFQAKLMRPILKKKNII